MTVSIWAFSRYSSMFININFHFFTFFFSTVIFTCGCYGRECQQGCTLPPRLATSRGTVQTLPTNCHRPTHRVWQTQEHSQEYISKNTSTKQSMIHSHLALLHSAVMSIRELHTVYFEMIRCFFMQDLNETKPLCDVRGAFLIHWANLYSVHSHPPLIRK